MSALIRLLLLLLVSTSVHAELLFEQAAPGVFVHHGAHQDLSEGYAGDICNISFIVGSKGVAVIDSGGSLKVGHQLHAAIRKTTALPILYVINTHVHPDHIYGNAAFVADRATFVGHAKLAGAMEQRKEAYARLNQQWMGDAFAGSELVKPALEVADTATLDLGDRQLQLQAHPLAHTNTDLTVQDSLSGTLWTGDLLFVERTPSIDGDIKGWIAVIDGLKKSTATQMVPGHGPVVKDWLSALDREQRYLKRLLDDVRASIKNGGTMEKAMDTAAADEKNNWQLFDIVNRRNVNMIYPGLEWE